ncbi:MAG: hypothetical protein QXK76_02110 [Candidatus Woesearchaeota archaeon]
MPIKPVSGPKCLKHQLECLYNCGWCGKPICDECIEFANGKKYCDKCWSKKQQLSQSNMQEVNTKTGPRQPVKNVDHTLDPNMVEKHRAELSKKKFDF